MPYLPNNAAGMLSIPANAEEMVRMFPVLVSTIHRLEQKISELENKVKSLEVIGGNVNQT